MWRVGAVEYYSAKKKVNFILCNNRNQPGEHYAK